MSTQSLRFGRTKIPPDQSSTKHPHLSIVQIFKEPLHPAAKKRDYEQPAPPRQASRTPNLQPRDPRLPRHTTHQNSARTAKEPRSISTAPRKSTAVSDHLDRGELALADLEHDPAAGFDDETTILQAIAIQTHPALIDHADRLRSARRQPGLLQHLSDRKALACALQDELRHVIRQYAAAEACLELLERLFGRATIVETLNDLLREQHLDVARIATILHFPPEAGDLRRRTERSAE